MSVAEQIERKIRAAFDVTYFELVNESLLHRGHSGDNGSGESHFKIILESADFKGCGLVAVQRRVYDALAEEMRYIHALSMEIRGR